MKIKTLVMLLVTTACFGAGGWLIYDHVQSIPPELEASTPAELIDFMLSPHFKSLSPKEQKDFIQQTMARYAAMTDAEREQVDEVVAKMREEDPDQLREAAMAVWKGFVVSEAEQFIALPLDERAAWVDARIGMWTAMASQQKPDPEQQRREQQHREDRDKPMTIERQREVVSFFQNEIYPRSTARERALVMALMKEAGPKFEKAQEKSR